MVQRWCILLDMCKHMHCIVFYKPFRSDIEVTNGAEYGLTGESDPIQVDYNCQGMETSLMECSQRAPVRMRSQCRAYISVVLKCRVLNIPGIIIIIIWSTCHVHCRHALCVYVMRKPWIGTIHGLRCPKLVWRCRPFAERKGLVTLNTLFCSK